MDTCQACKHDESDHDLIESYCYVCECKEFKWMGVKRKDYDSLIEAAEPEHKAWLTGVIEDTFSDNNYVAVNAKRMLGTYLGIIGNKKSSRGRDIEVKVEE